MCSNWRFERYDTQGDSSLTVFENSSGFRHYNDALTSGYGPLSHTKEVCLYAGVDSLMLVCQSKRERVGVRNVGVCVLVCVLVCM